MKFTKETYQLISANLIFPFLLSLMLGLVFAFEPNKNMFASIGFLVVAVLSLVFGIYCAKKGENQE